MKQHVFLIGYMGSGKTTLGKKLANRLGVAFFDTDALLETKLGCTIADFFAQYGEAAFRQEEEKLLVELDRFAPAVISLGGGLPCFGNNMDKLNTLGLTIYLKRSPGELANRLVKNKIKRPLIATVPDEDLRDFIAKHLEVREKIYSNAHFIAPRNQQTAEGLEAVILHKEIG
jgi:shikimate kinase